MLRYDLGLVNSSFKVFYLQTLKLLNLNKFSPETNRNPKRVKQQRREATMRKDKPKRYCFQFGKRGNIIHRNV